MVYFQHGTASDNTGQGVSSTHRGSINADNADADNNGANGFYVYYMGFIYAEHTTATGNTGSDYSSDSTSLIVLVSNSNELFTDRDSTEGWHDPVIVQKGK